MDKIFITDLMTSGQIGVNSPERDHPQAIIINLTLYLDTRQAGKSDDIADTVNYSTVAKETKAIVANSHFYTVEALAENIASQLLSNHPIQFIKVRVEKPNVVTSARSVGVEILRFRGK